jgi:hypothetical protein
LKQSATTKPQNSKKIVRIVHRHPIAEFSLPLIGGPHGGSAPLMRVHDISANTRLQAISI